MKKILVISYALGTSKGVGGRRWSKFISAFVRKKYNVFTLSETNHFDLEPDLVTSYFFETDYPEILNQDPKSIVNKLKYKSALKNRLKKTTGTPYDKTATQITEITDQAVQLVEKNKIDLVIISGAPFSLMTIAPSLKSRTQTKVFLDYRDAWTTGHGYGMNSIDVNRKKIEQSLEKQAQEAADGIIVASEDLEEQINDLLKKNKVDKPSMSVLNGIEFQDERPAFNPTTIKNLVHIGNVNIGTEAYWKPFLSLVQEAKLSMKFIGNNNTQVPQYCKDHQLDVLFVDRLPEKKMHEAMIEADLFVFFKRDDLPNSFPSKFFDYLKLNKPIIVGAAQGAVTNEIDTNKIGVVYEPNMNLTEFNEAISKCIANFNVNYDPRKFSIEVQADKIIRLIAE